MNQNNLLDLSQVVSPLCLLCLKSALKAMTPGEVITVKLQDPAVQRLIAQTLAFSGDRLIKSRSESDDIWLTIEKGHENQPAPD